MTRYELLNLLVSAISSVAVVVTVLYAAWQARAAREQSAVLSAQVVAEQMLALDRVFVDRPSCDRTSTTLSPLTARMRTPAPERSLWLS